MRFRYELRQGEQGIIQATSREAAEAVLERKGLEVRTLSLEQGRDRKQHQFIFGTLCLLGLLMTLVSFRLPHYQLGAGDDRHESVVLSVQGRLEGQFAREDLVLEVTFPELPTRLRKPWTEVGDREGQFLIRDELLIQGVPPTYYDLKAELRSGRLLAVKKHLPYPGDVVTLNILR